MKKTTLFWIILVIVLALVLFYVLVASLENKNKENENPNPIANPASVYCKENNGTLEIRTNEMGQYGVCLKNGKECEEWALFRGECSL